MPAGRRADRTREGFPSDTRAAKEACRAMRELDPVVPLDGPWQRGPIDRVASMSGLLAESDARLPRVVPKPWGHELWFAHTDRYAGKLLHVKAGHRLSAVPRAQGRDLQLALGPPCLDPGRPAWGSDRARDRAGSRVAQRGSSRSHHRGARRCHGLGVSTPELDDVVRLADQYGRATTSAAPSVIRRPRRRRH